MRIVDLSMTVEECDSAPFAKDEYYFKLKPIVKWEDKGFVSNIVEMTVHAGTDQIPSRVKVIALPAKWRTESAPARVIALLDA